MCLRTHQDTGHQYAAWDRPPREPETPYRREHPARPPSRWVAARARPCGRCARRDAPVGHHDALLVRQPIARRRERAPASRHPTRTGAYHNASRVRSATARRASEPGEPGEPGGRRQAWLPPAGEAGCAGVRLAPMATDPARTAARVVHDPVRLEPRAATDQIISASVTAWRDVDVRTAAI